MGFEEVIGICFKGGLWILLGRYGLVVMVMFFGGWECGGKFLRWYL